MSKSDEIREDQICKYTRINLRRIKIDTILDFRGHQGCPPKAGASQFMGLRRLGRSCTPTGRRVGFLSLLCQKPSHRLEYCELRRSLREDGGRPVPSEISSAWKPAPCRQRLRSVGGKLVQGCEFAQVRANQSRSGRKAQIPHHVISPRVSDSSCCPEPGRSAGGHVSG